MSARLADRIAADAKTAAALPTEERAGPESAPYLKRLQTPVSPHEQSTTVKVVATASTQVGETEDDAAVAVPPTIEDGPPPVDEAAESAFLAEARDRGEIISPKNTAAAESADESTKKPLPSLDDLVNQIPGEVRDVLEELFRARFVSVKRFPKKALKQTEQ